MYNRVDKRRREREWEYYAYICERVCSCFFFFYVNYYLYNGNCLFMCARVCICLLMCEYYMCLFVNFMRIHNLNTCLCKFCLLIYSFVVVFYWKNMYIMALNIIVISRKSFKQTNKDMHNERKYLGLWKCENKWTSVNKFYG